MSDRNAQGNGRGAEGAGAAGVRPGVWTGEAADAQANEDTQAEQAPASGPDGAVASCGAPPSAPG